MGAHGSSSGVESSADGCCRLGRASLSSPSASEMATERQGWVGLLLRAFVPTRPANGIRSLLLPEIAHEAHALALPEILNHRHRKSFSDDCLLSAHPPPRPVGGYRRATSRARRTTRARPRLFFRRR